jgi:hypothetical protein
MRCHRRHQAIRSTSWQAGVNLCGTSMDRDEQSRPEHHLLAQHRSHRLCRTCRPGDHLCSLGSRGKCPLDGVEVFAGLVVSGHCLSTRPCGRGSSSAPFFASKFDRCIATGCPGLRAARSCIRSDPQRRRRAHRSHYRGAEAEEAQYAPQNVRRPAPNIATGCRDRDVWSTRCHGGLGNHHRMGASSVRQSTGFC